MKKPIKKKATVLSMAMAFAVAIPLGTSAQEGLFQRGVSDEAYYGYGGSKNNTGFIGNRDATTGVINNQIFGQPVPVGSGMIILLAAGAGYAALKKRKEDEQ